MVSFVRRTRRAVVKSEYGSIVPIAEAVTPGNAVGSWRQVLRPVGAPSPVPPVYDYHLSSTAGSYHGGTFTPDSVDSPALDAGVRLLDTTTWGERATLRGHKDVLWGLDYSADGRLVATASADGTISIWPAPFAPAGTAATNR